MMNLGVEEARKTMNANIGGPFGAVITDKDDNVIAVASNTVLGSCDPTAHAEINAIRKAGQVLKTHDLSGCKIYATGYAKIMQMIVVASAISMLMITVVKVVALVKKRTKLSTENPPLLSVNE